MKRTPVRFSWTAAVKQLFGQARRKPIRRGNVSTRLHAELLDERIVPNHTYAPDPTVGDTNAIGSNSLRADITAANNVIVAKGATDTETFDLAANQTYSLTIPNTPTGHETQNATGGLDIMNIHGGGTKKYVFVGNGATIDQIQFDRVFDIIGNSSVQVIFENLTITGGAAVDNGNVGVRPFGSPSDGGGILNQGASVTLENGVHVEGNEALGITGGHGFNGFNATKTGEIAGSGTPGGIGTSANGGGIYSTSGSITIINSFIQDNLAKAGAGGGGGNGGSVGTKATGSGGFGGAGAPGGDAAGGGIYIAAGNLSISGGSQVEANTAAAGDGGAGGAGGKEDKKKFPYFGGDGGTGGTAGVATGGGIYMAVGNIVLNGDAVVSNLAKGGAGGAGGAAGNGAGALNNGGLGGIGGPAGMATGGGLYSQVGSVTITGLTTLGGNRAEGGTGGAGGIGGSGNSSNKVGGTGGEGGTGGAGASAFGGGIYAANGIITVEQSSIVGAVTGGVSGNAAIGGGGGAGGAGGAGAVHLAGLGAPGGAAGPLAEGGGIFAGVGGVTIESNSLVQANLALDGVGGAGGAGANVSIKSAFAGLGGTGGAGASAFGGGIYDVDGNVNVQTAYVFGNGAGGGGGGAGGAGGAGPNALEIGANGGAGGSAGNVGGGGIYVKSGVVTVNHGHVTENLISAGDGGNGGNGGNAKSFTAGIGGNAGAAASGEGGGVYVATGQVVLEKTGFVSTNEVRGGVGGTGGAGGIILAFNVRYPGGAGGNGGNAEGGGVWINTGSVNVPAKTFVEFNQGTGGDGGPGGLGGASAATSFQTMLGTKGLGGAGGAGQGGGIWTFGAAVAVTGNVLSNAIHGGTGGHGGSTGGGSGGPGGNAQGGGIYGASGSIIIDNLAKIDGNVATAGAGGSGYDVNGVGEGGAGGAGGTGQGGGVYSDSGNVSITHAVLASNAANGNHGGNGGNGLASFSFGGGGSGGAGGSAQGGGVYIGTGVLNLEHASINKNLAGLHTTGAAADMVGGNGGGTGGSFSGDYGGEGGAGGSAQGGGIYVSAGAAALSIMDSSITNNTAGPGGNGGAGGESSGALGKTNGLIGAGGNVQGGGLYTAANSLIVDSTIADNTALTAGGQGNFEGAAQGSGAYLALPLTPGGDTIANSTIAFNTSNDDGGGIENYALLSLETTIVADNTSNTTATDDFNDNGTTTATWSLIGTDSGNTVASQPSTNDNFVNVDPNLNPTLQVASNGTQYLGFAGTSDAIDIGENNPSLYAPNTTVPNPNPYNLKANQIGDTISLNETLDIGALQTGSTPVTHTATFIVTAGKNGFVEIINSTTHAAYQNFQPFPGYTGLVDVALGNVNANGVPDILVAAKGQVKVYSGADVSAPGVLFGVPSTWRSIGTPILYSFTPIPGYTGSLNIAAGNVNGDGYADIIVGTAAGTPGRVAVFSGATGLRISSIFYPFGASFKGGIVVAAGDVTGNGQAELIVGTQTGGNQVNIYQLIGSSFSLIDAPIDEFGNLPSNAQLQLAVLDVEGNGVDDIAIGLLENGVGTVNIVDQNNDIFSSINLGGGSTAFAITSVNLTGLGPDSLLIGTVPSGSGQFFIVDPTTGARTAAFSEFATLTGGISVAGT